MGTILHQSKRSTCIETVQGSWTVGLGGGGAGAVGGGGSEAGRGCGGLAE